MAGTGAVRRRLWALIGVVATVAVVLVPSAGASATADQKELLRGAVVLSGSQFSAGRIISDDQFYQTGAMSAAEIQGFLDTHVGVCANTKCLSIYTATTEKRAADDTCAGFTPDSDARERVAAIIYKVQQSCGISAKAILALIQQETGLVTHTAPTSGRLAAAMGWRCPASTPCDGTAVSLFRQLYGAVWQLKHTNTPDESGDYQVGTYDIAYSPDATCGTRSVAITNEATAALYSYTPYTPNAGALASLYGVADCGSYGNRNFWVYYSQWFGNPVTGTGLSEISAEYAASGGATGLLGETTGAGVCTRGATTCYRSYAGGLIYWTPSGAFSVSGDFGVAYLALGGVGGALGAPTTDWYAVADPNGDGGKQRFANGAMYDGPQGLFPVIGTMDDAYNTSGGLRGTMGWPSAARTCTSTGYCTQPTQQGTIYGTPTTAAALQPEFDAAYRAAGGPTGALGWPLANVSHIDTGANGIGDAMRTKGGMLLVSPTGTYAMNSRMLAAYDGGGGVRGVMGWPTAAPSCTLPGGGCSQTFQHGDVYLPKTGTGYALSEAGLAAAYRAAGGPAGALGWPSTASTLVTGVGTPGYLQGFASGAYLYSHDGSVFTLAKPYQAAYKSAGGVRGVLGWPVSAPACSLPGGGCTMTFEHGMLYQPKTGTGYVISNEAISTAYAAAGGAAGSLGLPRANTSLVVTTSHGRGYAQGFVGGFIYSSSAGTFVFDKVALAAYGKAGGVRGVLGWPTAAAVCDATGCAQAFQGGTLYTPATAASFAVTNAKIATYYAAHGGPAGALGYPTSGSNSLVTAKNGRGYVQSFPGGFVYSSTLGTFAVSGPMMTAYKAAGTAKGTLGFPKADATCTDGVCTQKFAHGTLTTP